LISKYNHLAVFNYTPDNLTEWFATSSKLMFTVTQTLTLIAR